jgi:hypothetical protein
VQAGERARVSLLCVRNGGAGLVSVEEGLDWGGLINQHMHFWTGVGLVRIPAHSQVYLRPLLTRDVADWNRRRKN